MSQRNGSRWRWKSFLRRVYGQVESDVTTIFVQSINQNNFLHCKTNDKLVKSNFCIV